MKDRKRKEFARIEKRRKCALDPGADCREESGEGEISKGMEGKEPGEEPRSNPPLLGASS